MVSFLKKAAIAASVLASTASCSHAALAATNGASAAHDGRAAWMSSGDDQREEKSYVWFGAARVLSGITHKPGEITGSGVVRASSRGEAVSLAREAMRAQAAIPGTVQLPVMILTARPASGQEAADLPASPCRDCPDPLGPAPAASTDAIAKLLDRMLGKKLFDRMMPVFDLEKAWDRWNQGWRRGRSRLRGRN